MIELPSERRLVQIIGEKRVLLVLLLSLLLLAVNFTLDKLPRTSGDVHSLFPRSSNELANFEDTNRLYGDYISDIVVVKTGKELTLEKREQLFEMEDELRELDGIDDVISPLTAFSDKARSPLPLRSNVNGNSRFILRIDGTLQDSERAKLNSEISRVLANYPKLFVSRTGPFFISESVTNVIEEETRRRTPFTLVALFLVGSFLLRSARLAALVLFAPVLSVVWIVLGAALFDVALGPVSQLVPPFILAVGASYSIHVATRLLTANQAQREITLIELRSAIFIAAATTIVGVMSLYLMDVRGVQEFALLAAMGVFLAASFALFMTPAFVSVERCSVLKLPAFFLRPEKRHFLVVLILGLSVSAGLGVGRVVVHTEPIMFLPNDSWERHQISETTESFPGNRLLSVVFKRASAKLREEDLALIAKISAKLSSLANVYSTVCDRDFAEVNKLRKDFSLASGNGIANAPTDITLEDLSATRILLETDLEGAKLLNLEREVRSVIEKEIGDVQKQSEIKFYVSGIELLVAQQTNAIVKGIIHSLLFTLLIVSVILLINFRDVLLMVIGLIPNIIPVITVLGAIGWLYQDINLGASLVGAAALSIAVDNTFHFMIAWRESRTSASKTSEAKFEAVCHTIRQCFPSFISTSFILITGFGIMALSSVLPVQQFGLLLAITLLVGLFADTIVLPYLMTWYESKRYS